MVLRCPLLLLAVAWGTVAWGTVVPDLPAQPETRAQDPETQQDPQRGRSVQEFEGEIIRQIEFGEGATETDRILSVMKTRAETPLRLADIADDVRSLWKYLKIVAWMSVEPVEGGGVILHVDVIEPRSYDRIVFQGLDHFSESEVRSILGLSGARRITDLQAEDAVRELENRYARDGYVHANVRLDKDEETSTLTFLVDEGPEVTIGEVHFRGNRAFPGDAPLNLYQNLIGGAELNSKPPGFLGSGDPFSEDLVEEDLDKLRIYYRRLGYRDAQVELAQRTYNADKTVVDLTFRIIEGRRYRVRNVSIEHWTADDELDPDPIYPPGMLYPELRVGTGDFYDRDQINRDKAAIERFYGKRGHPMSGRFGNEPIPEAFRWRDPAWGQPVEVFHSETAEIDLVYQLIEGTPKKLHDVKIQGNTETLDRVVRRKVYIYPGEILDVSEVERSLQILDSLRYFQNPEGLGGVRFELEPVASRADEVDLKILVSEGDTGSFLWGAGISTGFGVQARIQFNKRNFDLTRLPSSPNPVTIIDEIINSKAFHGAGQELNLFLAPGTEISTFQISFDEPDLFKTHVDTIGTRVQLFRNLRVLDSYDTDTTGAILGLYRKFSEVSQLGFSLRGETVKVEDIQPNAPTVVWASEGRNEVRSIRLTARFQELDFFLQPSDGYEITGYGEISGDILGGTQQFWKIGAAARYFYPIYRDSLDRAHVLFVRQSFDWGVPYGDDDFLFAPERYYMGGSNLRGFDQRRAGPEQFGLPVGGEARYLGTVEYQFPLVSTRLRGRVRETELLRGVLFSDWGLLGLTIDDPTFSELRLSVGVGVRIQVPYLGLPIALDFGFPVVLQETDDTRVFYFSLAR